MTAGFRRKPGALAVGDAWAENPSVYITEIHRDPEGVWVEWSDGDCGYVTRPIRVFRDGDDDRSAAPEFGGAAGWSDRVL